MALRSLCRSLLILNLAYCTLALFVPQLPGWKMFESAELDDYRFEDASGRSIDLRDYLPRDAHLTDVAQAVRVARFVCEREPQRGPFRLLRPAGDAVELSAEECHRATRR